MSATCNACGTQNPAENRFCGGCGQAIIKENLEEFQVNTLPVQGRRYISALFTDVVSSTELVRQLDPEQFERIMLLYQSIADEVVNDYGGEIIEIVGDGIVALFAGNESSTESSVHAGLELIDNIAELRPFDSDNGPLKLNIRVGISSGEALVKGGHNKKAQQLLGQPPYLASRLQSLAKKGQVLICPETYQKTRDYFDYSKYPAKQLKLKGFDDITEVWRALSAKESQFRFDISKRINLSPLSGRSELFKHLFSHWEAAKQKNGQVLLLEGAAGIGKSRVLAEFQRRIKRQSTEMITLRYQCSQFAVNAPLYPVMQQISRASRIKKHDTAEIITQKLSNLLDMWGVNSATFCPILLPLVLGSQKSNRTTTNGSNKVQNLSPKVISEALRACINLPLMFARRMPVLVIIEDMHWADAASNSLLHESIKRAGKNRILIVATYRSKQWEKPAFDEDFVHQHKLAPLSTDKAAALLDSIHLSGTLSDKQKQEILKKSAGNPLVIEELSHIIAKEAKIRNSTSAKDSKNGNGGGHFKTPSALFDLFIHRYDNFSPLLRSIEQLAAVIGQEFDFKLIANLLKLSPEQTANSIEQLLNEEQIFRIEEDSSWYQFRHALIRDAIYDNTLNHDKHRLHASIHKHLIKNKSVQSAVALNRIAHHKKMMEHYAAYT